MRPVENILCENFNLFHLLKSCSTQYESVVFLYLRAILIFLQNFKKSESKIAINEVENLIFHRYKSNVILYLHDLQVWVFSTTEL